MLISWLCGAEVIGHRGSGGVVRPTCMPNAYTRL